MQLVSIFVHLLFLLVLLDVVFLLLSHVNGAQCADHILVENLLELFFDHFLLMFESFLHG